MTDKTLERITLWIYFLIGVLLLISLWHHVLVDFLR